MVDPVHDAIARAAIENGVPVDLAIAIAQNESGLNPSAHNPGTAAVPEDSWGLFQLNRSGGEGTGFTPDQLIDPYFNAHIALAKVGAVYRSNSTLDGGTIAAIAQGPYDPGGYAAKINALLGNGAGAGVWGPDVPSSPAGGTGTEDHNLGSSAVTGYRPATGAGSTSGHVAALTALDKALNPADPGGSFGGLQQAAATWGARGFLGLAGLMVLGLGLWLVFGNQIKAGATAAGKVAEVAV